jgi:hypothetical protein
MIFERLRLSKSRASHVDKNPGVNGVRTTQAKAALSLFEKIAALFLLVSWLFLFAGGITMDTTQFRCAISAGGARALATEARPDDEAAKNICAKYDAWVPVGYASLGVESARTYRLGVAWLGVLLFFLPLNLAMVASAAGALGTMGNKANLEADPDPSTAQTSPTPTKGRDNSSPIISGLLRGLFIYLFFISGLLLFDDKPFSSPGPGVYIRLAGFISLLSFLVNYRPYLFATISDWAFDRVNARKPITAGARQEVNADYMKLNTAEGDKIKSPAADAKPATNGNSTENKALDAVKAVIEKDGGALPQN